LYLCLLYTLMIFISFIFSFIPRRPPISTLFPYTTLFRSDHLKKNLFADMVRLHDGAALPLPGNVDTDGISINKKSAQGIFTIVLDRKSTRLNSSHVSISYAVFCLKKKKKIHYMITSCHQT